MKMGLGELWRIPLTLNVGYGVSLADVKGGTSLSFGSSSSPRRPLAVRGAPRRSLRSIAHLQSLITELDRVAAMPASTIKAMPTSDSGFTGSSKIHTPNTKA